MDISELFWKCEIDDLKKGYVYDENSGKYTCLICGEQFEKGIIYPIENLYYDAQKAVEIHINKRHVSVFDYLINMNKKYTGLTEVQQEIIKCLYANKSDKEISQMLGVSASTVRNHRFKLREKVKQAKIFLCLMQLISENKKENNDKNNELIEIHKGATMVDERYAITEKEREKIINNYFKGKDNMVLSDLPSKEKRKIIVLQHIAKNFGARKKYTEKEVNKILKQIYEDYVLLRRYLIEYGFLERTRDCKFYWLKE
ncbi:bacterial regulatory protein, luxR family [Clostridium tepidiprofundi DSM 19306]|uniref:Bacterial regulatory protein, luxR family n=1 Tax=Clostridium tepidiprofundi DSM 19306 TaxID=1121338 RepID=A0A151APX3_9CLOT|nr:DUF2087 domain-containing protein [Clostridium tepidiprofundi]KYH29447.1 bacterial regulatory protein, luxR family [Clostridium tepidiprofundi DSM 19306]